MVNKEWSQSDSDSDLCRGFEASGIFPKLAEMRGPNSAIPRLVNFIQYSPLGRQQIPYIPTIQRLNHRYALPWSIAKSNLSAQQGIASSATFFMFTYNKLAGNKAVFA